MPGLRLGVALVILMAAPACLAARDLPPVQSHDAAAPATTHYRAVIVAGDDSLPVFDNAADRVAIWLRRQRAVASGALQRLSTTPAVIGRNGVRSASLEHVLDAVESMKPDAGEGCFVFATSHGAPHRGLVLAEADEFLNPRALDRALASGCGNAPTVVIISGCFSGSFTRAPMARANRIVLAAARPDRPSFGCGAGRTYTVYDRCLLDALDQGGAWQQAFGSVQRCVSGEERRERFEPSEPQAYFGSAMANLRLPASNPARHGPDLPGGYAGSASRTTR